MPGLKQLYCDFLFPHARVKPLGQWPGLHADPLHREV